RGFRVGTSRPHTSAIVLPLLDDLRLDAPQLSADSESWQSAGLARDELADQSIDGFLGAFPVLCKPLDSVRSALEISHRIAPSYARPDGVAPDQTEAEAGSESHGKSGEDHDSHSLSDLRRSSAVNPASMKVRTFSSTIPPCQPRGRDGLYSRQSLSCTIQTGTCYRLLFANPRSPERYMCAPSSPPSRSRLCLPSRDIQIMLWGVDFASRAGPVVDGEGPIGLAPLAVALEAHALPEADRAIEGDDER